MNKIWLIGASEGIGRALAEELGQNIDNFLILSARDSKRLETLSSDIKYKSMSCPLDVADNASVEIGWEDIISKVETIDTLKNDLDFHKATQAYIWAVPIVSYARWLESHEELFGAKDGQIVRLTSPKAKQGILTANATTPYAVAFADLSRTGPLVFDIPKGMSAGVVNDIWQRGIHDFGMSGPDQGNGAKLLILAPQMAIPDGLDTD